MKDEEWKTIKDHPNYMISNLGRVKSIEREIIYKRKTKPKKEKIIKQFISKDGYYIVGVPNAKRVHRLVAEAFLEDRTNFKYMPYEDIQNIDLNELEINHIDENPLNNNVNNLEWCTRAYNNNYGNRNEKSAIKHRTKVNQYDLQENLIKTWNSITEASVETNTSRTGIIACCKNKYKSSNNYIWRYENERI